LKAYTSRIAAGVKAAGPVLHCHTNHTKRMQGRNRWAKIDGPGVQPSGAIINGGVGSLAVAGDQIAQETRGVSAFERAVPHAFGLFLVQRKRFGS
jgi:hypothetical protein